MAEINEAQNEMQAKCPMCPWVLLSLAIIVRGKVRLSRLMKTSVRRGRCEKSGEKGAHEQAMMRSWMNAWAAWSGARRGDGARSLLRCDAPWSRGWRADGGNDERDDVVGDRQACVSDGCGARRMQLGRWWGWWRCWLATMALTGQWVARRWGRKSMVKTAYRQQWVVPESVSWDVTIWAAK